MTLRLVSIGGALLAASALFYFALAEPTPKPVESGGNTLVRLSIVNTPVMSGLIQDLVQDFEAQTKFKVEINRSHDAAEDARDGDADIVIAHYGKSGVKSLVLDGIGHWPAPLFANQLVLVGPKSDPADVRGAKDLAEAFQRIGTANSPFIENEIPGVMYLTKVVRGIAQNDPAKTDGIITGYAKGRAMRQAQKNNGYAIWGAYPFFRFKGKHQTDLEVLHSSDPLLQRMMAAIVVRKDKIKGVNEHGATAFQSYLVSPRAQSRIANFRSKDVPHQLWWPRGRDGSAVQE